MLFPKMILFDYGHTLLCEPDYDTLRATKALFHFIKKNKNHHMPEEVQACAQQFWKNLREPAVRQELELSQISFMRLLYEYLEIEFSVSWEEAEKIFWEHTTNPKIMPGAEQMLKILQELSIRTGVISNISFSGKLLAERMNRFFPGNQFEFILASSDYGVRKPCRYLFDIALKKAELSASQTWFCGDNPTADIEGALQTGIFPVWYENHSEKNFFADTSGRIPEGNYLHICEWKEMTAILDRLNREGNEK